MYDQYFNYRFFVIIGDVDHPEQPKRIQRIFEKHVEYGLLDRKNLIRLDSRKATDEELCLVHDLEHVTAMKNTLDLTQKLTKCVVPCLSNSCDKKSGPGATHRSRRLDCKC